jgi:hypothetical protein
MKAKDLARQLERLPPDSDVVCFVSWDNWSMAVNSVTLRDGQVVLSDRSCIGVDHDRPGRKHHAQKSPIQRRGSLRIL